jgi:hypothetical protein
MIVRICSDFVASDNVEAYLQELRRTIVPLYSSSPGLVSVSVLRRQLVAYGEISVGSTWESQDAMNDFYLHKPSLQPGLQHCVLRGQPITYDVVFHTS